MINTSNTVNLASEHDRLGPVNNRLLSIPDVAALLALSRSKTYQLVKEGIIPSVRIGRCVRVVAAEVDAFIHSHRSAMQKGTT